MHPAVAGHKLVRSWQPAQKRRIPTGDPKLRDQEALLLLRLLQLSAVLFPLSNDTTSVALERYFLPPRTGMAEPLAIVGAIAACQQIISRLAKVVKAVAIAEKEQASMVLRLHHQAILLQGFSEFVVDFGSDFDSDLRNHFENVVKHMQIVLDRTLLKMEKVRKKKPNKFLWALAGDELREAEKELFEWSQRLIIAFAFLSTPLKQTFVEKFSTTPKDQNDLPSWLLGLAANIRMEKGRNSVPVARIDQTASTGLDEPAPWNSLPPGSLGQLWIDRIKTVSNHRQGKMTMDEIQIEVGRLFAVLKHADSVSNRILTAEHFLITDHQEYRFAIASSLPDDTRNHQLLSDMLVEPSPHVSVSRPR
jgi:hypothetical protein